MNKLKKFVALIMTLAMLVSLVPSTFAEDFATPSEAVYVEETPHICCEEHEDIHVHEVAEEPEAAPEVAEEPEAAPEVAEEPEAAPEVAEEPEAAPEVAEEPEAAPEVAEEPEAATEVVEEPEAAPEVAEEPEAAPEVAEEPEAAPEVVEEIAETVVIAEAPVMLMGIMGNTCEELGHDWEKVITKSATCTETGVIRLCCTRCGTVDNSTYETISAYGHDWEMVITKSPTCTEQGVKRPYCQRCGTTDTDNSNMQMIPALGHDNSTYVITKSPTCTEQGVKRPYCQRCQTTDLDNSKMQMIPALGHDYTGMVTTLEPTCTAEGVKRPVCSRCGVDLDNSKMEWIPALGHNYDQWLVTVQPTCTEKGERRPYCSRCNQTNPDNAERVLLAPLGHQYKEWVTIKEATCIEEGARRPYCTRCESLYPNDSKDSVIPRLDHNFDKANAYVYEESTCTYRGKLAIPCAYGCGNLTYEQLPFAEHDFGDWTIKEPTCTEKGEKTRKCKKPDCMYEETEERDALGHDWTEWTTTKEPTCTEKGEEIRTCQRELCDAEEIREIEPLGHDWTEWTTVLEPTCTKPGAQRRECQREDCVADMLQRLDPLGHTPGEMVITEPTCTQDGAIVVPCDVCGEELEKLVLEALGHDLTHYEAKEPTYDDIGWYEYDVCSRGDYNTYVERPKLERPHVEPDKPAKSSKKTSKPSSKNCLIAEWTYNDEEIKGDRLLISNYRLGLKQRYTLESKIKDDKVVIKIKNDTTHTVNFGLSVSKDTDATYKYLDNNEALFENLCYLVLAPGQEYIFEVDTSVIGVQKPVDYDEENAPKRSDANKDILILVDADTILEIKKR